ncbi:MAG: hypothetical protein HY961_05125 [Ignavibacteriae bacterium]|nr:hypothetical protein [Ignavibacteriota bacterium]
MKRTVLACVLVLMVVGCEQNQPVGIEGGLSNAQKSGASPDRQKFTFENIVRDLDNPAMQYNAQGEVEYAVDQLPIMHTDMVDVAIDFDAELDNPMSDKVPVSVKGSSMDRIALSPGGVGNLVKQYDVEALGTTLYARYEVTTTSLELKELWLQNGQR